MSNISGITLGALFMFVGIMTFDDPSVVQIKKIFIFLGLFIICIFMNLAIRQSIAATDPNYGRETSIKEYDEMSNNANNAAKARGFDSTTIVFALMLAAFVALNASWAVLGITLAGYLVVQGVSAKATSDEYKRMWNEHFSAK